MPLIWDRKPIRGNEGHALLAIRAARGHGASFPRRVGNEGRILLAIREPIIVSGPPKVIGMQFYGSRPEYRRGR
jgi:hypothetical protein